MESYLLKSNDKTNNPDKYALFIGRWQPFHEGHNWLINQKLKDGKKVCIAIRDVPKDDKNWWSAEEIKEMLHKELEHLISAEMVKVIIIPDIESINIGRGVGYDIIEHVPPTEIREISATRIREHMAKNK